MTSYKQSGRLLGFAVLVIVGLMTALFQVTKFGGIDVMSDLTNIWIWIAAALIGVAFNLITGKRGLRLSPYREQMRGVDERFHHLKFHFSRETDMPAGTHEKPNYVVNHHTHVAYPISSMLEPYLKNISVEYESHSNEAELKKSILEQTESKSTRRILSLKT